MVNFFKVSTDIFNFILCYVLALSLGFLDFSLNLAVIEWWLFAGKFFKTRFLVVLPTDLGGAFYQKLV